MVSAFHRDLKNARNRRCSRRSLLTRQIHFDQCLFGRALAPPIALDDRGLEGLLPKLDILSGSRWPWSAVCARNVRRGYRDELRYAS